MSAPEFERVLGEHVLHASMNVCLCRDWRATPDAGSLLDQHRAHIAAALNAEVARSVRETLQPKREEAWQRYLKARGAGSQGVCQGRYDALSETLAALAPTDTTADEEGAR